MIVVKLQGGLGNQMFQYAIGRSLAEKNKDKLVLDLTFVLNKAPLKNFSYRGYRLSVFNVNNDLTFLSKLNQRIPIPVFFPKTSYVINKIRHKIGTQQYICEAKEMEGRFNIEIFNLKGSVYLDGYWQNENYFKDVSGIIRREFMFKHEPDSLNKKMLEKINSTNSISLHVRCGDYVTNPKTLKVHGFLGLDYYKNAINLVKQKVKNPEIFVFSDDIPWVKKKLKINLPVNFMEHNGGYKDYEDMRLMSRCKHHIIANSSFSWWGAWLSENYDKIIIAPKRWFSDEEMKKRREFDIIPKSWIKI